MASLRKAEKLHLHTKLQSFQKDLPLPWNDEEIRKPASKLLSSIRGTAFSGESLRRGKWLHAYLRSLNQRQNQRKEDKVKNVDKS